MTYQDAIKYLDSFISYERKTNWTYSNKTLNLDRFKDLLKEMGDPQFGFKSIHVAGSDGKGSVCAMISSVLQSRGYSVGVFSSPHLQNIRERITINNQWISEKSFALWVKHLRNINEQRPPLPTGFVTFFEMITAMAFLHFQKEKVDFAVIETGLGGRLDTTNVMNPLLNVITHISLEHTAQLGDSLEAIADEKLGITRPRTPVIIGNQDKTLLPHFHKRLEDHLAPVVYTNNQYQIKSHKNGIKYRTLVIETHHNPSKLRSVRIPLFGHYQIENAITAIAAVDNLAQDGEIEPLSTAALDKGLKTVHWPGRFEIIKRPDKPLTVIDVAHTAKGAASLQQSLDELYPKRRRIFVLGFLKGKKITEMLQNLLRSDDRVILTRAPSPRGVPLSDLEEEFNHLNIHKTRQDSDKVHPYLIEQPADALHKAESLAAPGDLICIAGSLYLAGEIRSIMNLD